MALSTDRKLGRPPAASGAETRSRILEAARRCFSEYGYETTTNKMLASEAGLTTGAIYHYFDSKTDVYLAAHIEVQALVYDRFRAASDPKETFHEKIEAVLDEAVELNLTDPSLATFLVTVRTDVERHPELVDVLPNRSHPRREFFGGLIELGIETGEIAPEDATLLYDVTSAVLTGLVVASSSDHETHVRTVEGIKRLLAGTLLQPAT